MAEDIRLKLEDITPGEPWVSVIIPVYNVKRYLKQCLESVISQTYQNIEIIIIDDGSTDGSGPICDRYAARDSHIRVIHSPNRGLASARNLGLEKTGGAYIFFVDSDDWIELHAIETLVRAALKTGADIVTARNSVEYVGKTVHAKTAPGRPSTYCGLDILPVFAEEGIGNVVWNKLYRAACFEGIRYPDGHNFEDVFTTWKIVKKLAENGGRITVLPDELFHFRKRKSSISNTWIFGNTNDYWAAYLAKYRALPDYKEEFLPGCFVPISHAWMSFCSYPREDQRKAEGMLREMQAFSKKNFRSVMRGGYSANVKMICLLSQSRNAAVMRIGFWGGKLRQAYKDIKYKMYD